MLSLAKMRLISGGWLCIETSFLNFISSFQYLSCPAETQRSEAEKVNKAVTVSQAGHRYLYYGKYWWVSLNLPLTQPWTGFSDHCAFVSRESSQRSQLNSWFMCLNHKHLGDKPWILKKPKQPKQWNTQKAVTTSCNRIYESSEFKPTF